MSREILEIYKARLRPRQQSENGAGAAHQEEHEKGDRHELEE